MTLGRLEKTIGRLPRNSCGGAARTAHVPATVRKTVKSRRWRCMGGSSHSRARQARNSGVGATWAGKNIKNARLHTSRLPRSATRLVLDPAKHVVKLKRTWAVKSAGTHILYRLDRVIDEFEWTAIVGIRRAIRAHQQMLIATLRWRFCTNTVKAVLGIAGRSKGKDRDDDQANESSST